MSPACTGAWIETILMTVKSLDGQSPACTGAWIETSILYYYSFSTKSPACTGAWIETSVLGMFDRRFNVARLYGGVD